MSWKRKLRQHLGSCRLPVRLNLDRSMGHLHHRHTSHPLPFACTHNPFYLSRWLWPITFGWEAICSTHLFWRLKHNNPGDEECWVFAPPSAAWPVEHSKTRTQIKQLLPWQHAWHVRPVCVWDWNSGKGALRIERLSYKSGSPGWPSWNQIEPVQGTLLIRL